MEKTGLNVHNMTNFDPHSSSEGGSNEPKSCLPTAIRQQKKKQRKKNDTIFHCIFSECSGGVSPSLRTWLPRNCPVKEGSLTLINNQRLETGKQRGYLQLALCSGGCGSPLESLDWILSKDQIQNQFFSRLLQLVSTWLCSDACMHGSNQWWSVASVHVVCTNLSNLIIHIINQLIHHASF